MTQDQYQDMVIAHDKHIDTLATSIENLASSVGTTNTKLNDVIDVITLQNVLIERVNNLDTNVAESFKRAWARFDKIETVVDNGGCAAAKNTDRVAEVHGEKIKVVNNRLTDLEGDVKEVTEVVSSNVSSATVKWVMGLLIMYSVLFGTYVVQSIHWLETAAYGHQVKSGEIKSSIFGRLDKMEASVHEHHGN